MNRACNRCLFTWLACKLAHVHPAVGWIVGNLAGSRANNIYSRLTYNCTCQPGSRVIRAFSDLEKPIFLFGS